MRNLLALLSGSMLLALANPVGAEEVPAAPAPDGAGGAAIARVEKLHEDLLSVMRAADTLGYQGRYDRLFAIVTESFDLPFMAEKTVGRHWKTLSDQEQERWLTSFHEMTAATYAGRFEGFSGQRFEVLGEEPAKHGTAVVRARLVNPGEEDTQLNYRLHDDGHGWRIIDVYLNGTVSELALRRSEYASVLKREGFDKLIETIDGKTQELAGGSIN